MYFWGGSLPKLSVVWVVRKYNATPGKHRGGEIKGRAGAAKTRIFLGDLVAKCFMQVMHSRPLQ